MTICVVIAGCDIWEDIEDFCRVKEKWIREALHMELPNRLPSHDTIQRVWGTLKLNESKRCFRGWVESVCGTKEGEIISIDGKTLRRSGGQGKESTSHGQRMGKPESTSAWTMGGGGKI